MRRTLIIAVALNLTFGGLTIAQDKATPGEVIAKVREAASELAKTGNVDPFKQKQSPWVWKNTYVFVQDCDKKVTAANPMFPNDVGRDLASVKSPGGKQVYPNPTAFCDAARNPSGTWIEYLWPKPGEKQGSRKISYFLGAKGTPYVVGAGIYDDNATIKQLTAMSSK